MRILPLTALFIFALVASTYSQTTKNFVWDANTEPDLAGYNVYTCTSEPCTKATGIVLGSTVNTTFPVPEGSGFAFVTAYDSSGNESGESNVVAYFLDLTAPGAPGSFRIE